MLVKSKGFTLIELLIVLLIISITFSFALMSMSNHQQNMQFKTACAQLISSIKFLQQQAILESSTLGIVFKDNTYTNVRFTPPNKWQPLHGRRQFSTKYFPTGTVFNSENHLTNQAPQIIINTIGQITPCILIIRTAQQSASLYINNDEIQLKNDQRT